MSESGTQHTTHCQSLVVCVGLPCTGMTCHLSGWMFHKLAEPSSLTVDVASFEMGLSKEVGTSRLGRRIIYVRVVGLFHPIGSINLIIDWVMYCIPWDGTVHWATGCSVCNYSLFRACSQHNGLCCGTSVVK